MPFLDRHFPLGLFSFRGRLSRRPFLYCIAAFIVLTILLGFLQSALAIIAPVAMTQLIYVGIAIILIGWIMCQEIRRYHDIGIGAWCPTGFFALAFVLQNVLAHFANPAATSLAGTIIHAVSLIVFVFIPLLTPGTERGRMRFP